MYAIALRDVDAHNTAKPNTIRKKLKTFLSIAYIEVYVPKIHIDNYTEMV